MMAMTSSQWNWITLGAAVLLLALIVVASGIWNWLDERRAHKRKRQAEARQIRERADEEANKAA